MRENERPLHIDPLKLAFDFDGVIADTMALFIDIARYDFNIYHIAYSDITEYRLEDCLPLPPGLIELILTRLKIGDYRFPLNPTPGAVGFLNKFIDAGKPVLLVTARHFPGPLTCFLKEHLGSGADNVQVVATGSFNKKISVLKEHGITFFVEDRLDTCMLLKESGITPILYKQPWNRNGHASFDILEISNLEALTEYVRFTG